MCEDCDDTGLVEEYCGGCNGSGEGMYDGSTCQFCNGLGVEYVECKCVNLTTEETDEDDRE